MTFSVQPALSALGLALRLSAVVLAAMLIARAMRTAESALCLVLHHKPPSWATAQPPPPRFAVAILQPGERRGNGTDR